MLLASLGPEEELAELPLEELLVLDGLCRSSDARSGSGPAAPFLLPELAFRWLSSVVGPGSGCRLDVCLLLLRSFVNFLFALPGGRPARR